MIWWIVWIEVSLIYLPKGATTGTSVWFILYKICFIKEKVIVPRVLIRIIWSCLKIWEMPHRLTILQDKFIQTMLSIYKKYTCRDATTPPFGYLFIDLKQETQENLRLRANILKSRQQVYICTSRYQSK